MSDLLHAAAMSAQPFVELAGNPVPNPANGGGDPLPGGAMNDFAQILRWAFGIISVLAVAGILGVAAKMIMSHRNGEGGEHMGALGKVLGGLILAAASSGMINLLIG
ncbi:hypothetical protein [Streptomyces chryseus]|uniref:hypothetical protein n=1 Tax=Streptomyces chryseus TaxID=68186 RepID=UPI00110FBFDA|nr:hypothetical protein [Streptomyces chryseus]GGX36625.1 hypothetical protein GCM10010353_59680 [Streptomyces chryseus]